MTSKNPIVKTQYGPVKGVLKSTALGRTIYDFRTVPYMRAPTGKLRFRDAQAPEKWSEPLNANVPRPCYFIRNYFTKQIEGQEDAGIVSVSTPYLDRNLPVAVFIHGGGFQYAYGEKDLFGGDYLLQKDFVFVTINYRVGPIGFLSLQDPELDIPGNAGMKDQVFALKWVQKNIANFGGNSNDVTIFGGSAGGASVHLLMMSELSKGLFHRAIPMSGTSFIKAWPFSSKKELTERLAIDLGWDGTGGEKEILHVLESASAKELIEAESRLLTNEEIFAEHVLFPFTPVIEPYVNGRTFLPKDPVLLGRDAWSNDIDCIIGGTSMEGGVMFSFLNDVKGNFHEYLEDPAALTLVRELGLNMDNPTDKRKAIEYGEKLKKLYFGEEPITPDLRNQYLMYASDLHFMHGIYRAVLSRIHSRGKGKTYFYRFDLKTDLNLMKLFCADYEGASHGDDCTYVFKPDFPGIPTPEIDSKEHNLVKKVVSYLTSFIINGDPNGLDNEGNWEIVTSEQPLKCLNIANNSSEMIELPELNRLKVWDEICDDCKVPLY